MKKILMSWSSGKDSAWALKLLLEDPEYDVVGLFTTVNKKFDRVAMHAVRLDLLKKQAECIGLPLEVLEIPYPCSNEDYETVMKAFVERTKEQEIEYFAFGDLYLEDVRDYRLEKLNGTGIKAVFPAWGLDTKKLSREMVDSGIKTYLTCIDPNKLDPCWAGKLYNHEFLDSLSDETDPCGENGEFHSFVINAPFFKESLEVKVGKVVEREGFVFADIV